MIFVSKGSLNRVLILFVGSFATTKYGDKRRARAKETEYSDFDLGVEKTRW